MTGPLLWACLCASIGAEGKASPELAPGGRMRGAGKPLGPATGTAAPFVGDFDGDGVKDLLVGQFGDGLLWIYRNEGTNDAPRLAAGVKFKEGKADGRVPTGSCVGFGPQLVDLDGDGHVDLL